MTTSSTAGRAFIANPHLVRRVREDAPLNALMSRSKAAERMAPTDNPTLGRSSRARSDSFVGDGLIMTLGPRLIAGRLRTGSAFASIHSA
jgi:hypothetical protein